MPWDISFPRSSACPACPMKCVAYFIGVKFAKSGHFTGVPPVPRIAELL